MPTLDSFVPFLTGFVIGVVFALLRVDVPAPPTLAGAFGVVGLTFGYLVVVLLRD